MTIRPLAIDGWMFTPVIVTVAESAENVSASISPAPVPSSVYATTAPMSFGSRCITPLPISSSQVNTTRTGPCGISGFSARTRAASMMTATPALSSAPSSVVPSVVMIVLPTSASSSGFSATRITFDGSFGSTMSPPS